MCLSLSISVLAQDGLQGFDRNYPNTPAGDNARGFTPEITPLTAPPAVASQLSVDEPTQSQNSLPAVPDPFAQKQPQPADDPIPGVE